jgi:hypothetical protein
MPSMVVFECGQKRQHLAHFQDDAAELVGTSRRTRAYLQRRRQNFINKCRRIAPKTRGAE